MVACLKLVPRVLLRMDTVPLMAAVCTAYLLGWPGMHCRYSWREIFIIPVAPITIGFITWPKNFVFGQV